MSRELGVPARRADTERDLDAALQEAGRTSGPFLIDVAVDPSGYGAMLRAVRG